MNHCKVYFYVIHWISSWVESSPSFTLLKMSTISYAANTFALEVVANKIWAVKFNCNSNVDSFVVMLNHGHCVWMTDATYITKRCQVPSLIFSPYWIPPWSFPNPSPPQFCMNRNGSEPKEMRCHQQLLRPV